MAPTVPPPEEVQAHVQVFRQRLAIPTGRSLDELGACPITDVPASDRPVPPRED